MLSPCLDFLPCLHFLDVLFSCLQNLVRFFAFLASHLRLGKAEQRLTSGNWKLFDFARFSLFKVGSTQLRFASFAPHFSSHLSVTVLSSFSLSFLFHFGLELSLFSLSFPCLFLVFSLSFPCLFLLCLGLACFAFLATSH